ncbi:MAG: hypothetical protein R3B52_02395 [Candidatus Paceibacterota bacterium]
MHFKSKRHKEVALLSKVKQWAYILVGIGAFFGLCYLVIFSPLFQVSRFQIYGLNESTSPKEFLRDLNSQVLSSSGKVLLGENSLFVWERGEHYSDQRFMSIEVKKSFKTREVQIYTKPKIQYLSWCKSKIVEEAEYLACQWVDETGQAFESAPNTSGQLILSIHEPVSTIGFERGEKVVLSTQFEYLKSIIAAMKAKKVSVEKILLHRDLQEFQFKTKNGTTIRFSYRFDPGISAIPALAKLADDENLSAFSEVNLSVKNRVFFTEKGSVPQPKEIEESTEEKIVDPQAE